MPISGREPRRPDHHLVTVFEAANDTLKEVYVGTTNHLIDALTRQFQTDPPQAVSHWRKGHRVLFRCVEYSIAGRDAGEFIAKYAKSTALKDWKVFTEQRSED